MSLANCTVMAYLCQKNKKVHSILCSLVVNTADIVTGDPPSLGEFPQGYSLWGHFTKTKEPDGRGVKERVTHDLYGHPSGEEFRTPSDFYPHLRWLAFDTLGDVAACACKFCDLANESEANKKRALRAQAVSNAMKKSIIDKGTFADNLLRVRLILLV